MEMKLFFYELKICYSEMARVSETERESESYERVKAEKVCLTPLNHQGSDLAANFRFPLHLRP